MRAGVYVDLLSIFSAASGNAHPISPANAERLAQAQYTAMARARAGRPPPHVDQPCETRRRRRTKKGVSVGTIVLAVFVVAILAAAVATPGLLQRRRLAQEAAATRLWCPALRAPSAGDAVDDLREHTG